MATAKLVPPPQPEPEVVLTMTMTEANCLRCIMGCDKSIPRELSHVGYNTEGWDVVMGAIHKALCVMADVE